jgi:hypothetical protein
VVLLEEQKSKVIPDFYDAELVGLGLRRDFTQAELEKASLIEGRPSGRLA